MEKVKSKVHDLKRRISKDESVHHNGRFVLITNGTGYVSTWIIRQFLSNGYKVRTTVHSNQEAQDVRDTFQHYAHNLEVNVLRKADSLVQAVDGVDGIVITEPEGWRQVLDAVVKDAPQVHRVVVTSSLEAVVDPGQTLNPGHTYTEKDWNPSSEEKAVYAFLRERQPNFTLATICPATIWGPLAHKTDLEGVKKFPEAKNIWFLMEGEGKGDLKIPAFVDVRNVAQAHLRAYEHGIHENDDDDKSQKSQKSNKTVEEERYIVSGGPVTKSQLRSVLKQQFPERRLKIPKPENEGEEPPYTFDNTKLKDILCMMTLINLDDCLRDMGKSLLEVEGAIKKGVRYDGQEWFTHV